MYSHNARTDAFVSDVPCARCCTYDVLGAVEIFSCNFPRESVQANHPIIRKISDRAWRLCVSGVVAIRQVGVLQLT